jgi:predicted glycosyltransferase
MKIMVGVSHPKHVHARKNLVNSLIRRGHDVKIVATGKDITLKLLDSYGYDYEVVGNNYKGLPRKAYGLVKSIIKTNKVAKKFGPDILVGGNPYLSYISKLIGKPHIGFTDTENASLNNWISFVFSDLICTPSCYKGTLNQKKHVKYNGYEELGYLHPNYFKPDKSIFDSLAMDQYSKYIILRFVDWGATHDIGDKGFSDKVQIVKSLEKYARILITSEAKLPKELEKYKISISPEKIHDLMYYANLFIGESASMACESAILGTPSIYVSTTGRGYTDELEKKYALMYSFSDPIYGQSQAFDKAVDLLSNENVKLEWGRRRDVMLSEKIDVTSFLVELIESYPDSFLEVLEKYECSYSPT